jgi:hypothetical protein
MPMTAIDDFKELAAKDKRFGALHEIVAGHNGLWCAQAEEYLLSNWD